jgi:transposase InsO family protein
MARIPTVTRDQVPEQFRAAFDEVVAASGGAITSGPGSITINSPEMARRRNHLTQYLRYETTFPKRLQELAIITTARAMDCPYVWNAHAVWSKNPNLPFYWRLRPLPSPHFTLSSALPSRILIGNMDSNDYRGEAMDWKHLLAYITGTVDQELLVRNEYLVTENRILRDQLKRRVRLSDGERKALAEIGQKLSRQALKDVAQIVKPDTILTWHRKLVAQKFDGSQQRKAPGRPIIDQELEALIVRIARENRSWGYDRIVGALANLGLTISDQTVGNILKRHGIPPAPERKTTTTWKEFIRTHMEVLVATDFFTAEVWTLGGLVTYYVLCFIRLSTREIHVAGMTSHPNEAWMMQIARNVTMEEWGFLSPGQYLIHDRDGKYCPAFQQLIDAAGVKRVPLPPRSPNLNAYAERWVRSVKEECLSRLILLGEASLQHALHEYVEHYHHERNHQGKGNVLLFPSSSRKHPRAGPMRCRERLGGLLKYYEREAA